LNPAQPANANKNNQNFRQYSWLFLLKIARKAARFQPCQNLRLNIINRNGVHLSWCSFWIRSDFCEEESFGRTSLMIVGKISEKVWVVFTFKVRILRAHLLDEFFYRYCFTL
jgi:hypothetical protein